MDDKIATLCIDKTSGGVWVPETVGQLTDRVLRAAPLFMGGEYCDLLAENGYAMLCKEPDQLMCPHGPQYLHGINVNGIPHELSGYDLCKLSPSIVRYHFPAFEVFVDYLEGAQFSTGQNRKFTVTIFNAELLKQQHWVNIRLLVPNGVCPVGGASFLLPLNSLSGSKAEASFVLDLSDFTDSRLEAVVDVSLVGRHSSGCVKVVFHREA